jgi:DNA-binding MarR family transcriptional regulator
MKPYGKDLIKVLVVRVPGPKDAREKIVYLTDDGKRVMDKATKIVQGILDVACAGFPRTTCGFARRCCGKFTKI